MRTHLALFNLFQLLIKLIDWVCVSYFQESCGRSGNIAFTFKIANIQKQKEGKKVRFFRDTDTYNVQGQDSFLLYFFRVFSVYFRRLTITQEQSLSTVIYIFMQGQVHLLHYFSKMWISVSKSAVKIFAQDLFSSYDIDEITETKKTKLNKKLN